jgi:hypothetical protein
MNDYDRSTVDRILARVEKTETCWLWRGAKSGHGYGVIGYRGRQRPAHRVLYELTRAPVPKSLDIDHLCRVRNCVNPDHLEPVTHQENCKRGINGGDRHNAAKTHCKNGHPFSGDNLYIGRQLKGGIQRRCRTCHRERALRRYHELKSTGEMKP